jgi:8-oxo-dGTP diphosphatase
MDTRLIQRQAQPPGSKLAVLALIPYEAGILLGERGPEANGGVGEWGPPGGSVDPGETPEEALIREIYEEAGLVTIKLIPFSFTVGTYELRGSPRQVVSLYYRAITTGQPQCKEPTKCTQWRGFAWDGLPDPLFDGIAQLRAQHPHSPFS